METVYAIINSNALSGIVGLLIGIFIGHRLQLWLSRRSEYNELADPLFLRVDRVLEAHSAHTFHIPEDEVKLLRRRMSPWHRKRFDAALAKYNDAAEKQTLDNLGHAHFTDPDEVNDALRQVAKVLGRQ